MARKRRSRQIDKALPGVVTSPAAARGSVADMSTQAAIAAAAYDITTATRGGLSVPLPRDPSWGFAPFGPGQPLYPAPLDRTRPDTGRAVPRFYEYPVSWNLTGTANRLTSWELLRAAADGVSLFRRCIEIRKDHMLGLDWDIVIGQSAIEAAQAQEGRNGAGRAALEDRLRQEMGPEIDRAATFLAMPDRGNGYEFAQWLSMLLEEVFVLDAAAIYPRRTYGGDLFAFEALDGTTIKPLLDERGGRPLPPYPAYQQILYGFPRGEFTADVRDEGGTEVIPGAYASDELIYSRRVVRTWTPYGYSAVEQALDDGDLYMKRHIWMKGEYTEGTSVAGLYKIDPAAGTGMWSPEQILTYERQFNDAYSGDLAARQGARFLPPGVEPVLDANGLSAMAERYKPEYDLHLIKLLASHFDTTLPELGFTEAKGLGSEGYHEGQADVQHRKTRPIIKYIEGMITGIMRRHANMPKELQFKFLGLDDEDEPGADDVSGKRQAQGILTMNERRDDLGLPRFAFPEADMPMILTGRGIVYVEGSSALQQPGTEVDPPKGKNPLNQADPAAGEADPAADKNDPETGKPQAKPGAVADKAKSAEFAAYRKWSAKLGGRRPARPFVFEHCTADELAGVHPDVGPGTFVIKATEGEAVRPKAPAPPGRQWPGWEHDVRVVAHYVPRLRRALLSALRGPNTATRLATTWLASRAEESHLGVADARAWLADRGIDLVTPLRRLLLPIWTEGYLIGDRSAAALLAAHLLDMRKAAGDPYEAEARPDWGSWTPGDAKAARLMLDADGRLDGLRAMLERAGVSIASIAEHRLDALAAVLHTSLGEGWSGARLAAALRSVLDDSRWARMVATTETARAVSQASLGRYRDNGVEAKEWMSAEDQRVCKICNENEGDGPIALDAYFNSGDDAPPGHPDCRCAIAPAWVDAERLATQSGQAGGGAADALGWYGTGADVVEALGGDELAGDLGAVDEAEVEIEEIMAEYEADLRELAEVMEADEVTVRDISNGNYGHVDRITTARGTYVRKTIRRAEEGMEADRQQDAEQLAALVGRAFGLDTPAVARLAADSVGMAFMNGTMADELTDAVIARAMATIEADRMRLFDLLISNRDRNGGNWLVGDGDGLQLIDHGGAFQPWAAPGEVPAWPEHMLTGWASGETWIENLLSQGDVIALKGRLAKLESTFTDLGRHDWYDAMWQRLEVLAQHARGTERMIP
jgi:SPP1 gp7 family putative phage head morphogenesis protein